MSVCVRRLMHVVLYVWAPFMGAAVKYCYNLEIKYYRSRARTSWSCWYSPSVVGQCSCQSYSHVGMQCQSAPYFVSHLSHGNSSQRIAASPPWPWPVNKGPPCICQISLSSNLRGSRCTRSHLTLCLAGPHWRHWIARPIRKRHSIKLRHTASTSQQDAT